MFDQTNQLLKLAQEGFELSARYSQSQLLLHLREEGKELNQFYLDVIQTLLVKSHA